jgi:hypothetical protein
VRLRETTRLVCDAVRTKGTSKRTMERHGLSGGGEERVKASRPLIRVLVINDNHYGLTILFEL